MNREAVIDLLTAVRSDIRRNGVQNFDMIMAICRFVNKLFCDCRYVEYWVFDMNFGQNECMTELGHELRGIDTIEKFTDFLFSHAQDKP